MWLGPGQLRVDIVVNSLLCVPNPCASEKAVAPHSSTLAWKIPWTEEPDRLQSMGSQRVGHDWATSLSLFTFMHWRRKWQPTPVFLPGESQGQRSLVGCHLWGRTESDTTEATYQQQQQKFCLVQKDGNQPGYMNIFVIISWFIFLFFFFFCHWLLVLTLFLLPFISRMPLIKWVTLCFPDTWRKPDTDNHLVLD